MHVVYCKYSHGCFVKHLNVIGENEKKNANRPAYLSGQYSIKMTSEKIVITQRYLVEWSIVNQQIDNKDLSLLVIDIWGFGVRVFMSFVLRTVSLSDPALVEFHLFDGSLKSSPRLDSGRYYLWDRQQESVVASVTQLYRVRVFDAGHTFGPVVRPASRSIWHKNVKQCAKRFNKSYFNLETAMRSHHSRRHSWVCKAKWTCICIAHRREAPLMRCRLPYVGADPRKLAYQPGIQRTLRDYGYGLVYMPICSPRFRWVLIPA